MLIALSHYILVLFFYRAKDNWYNELTDMERQDGKLGYMTTKEG